MSPIKPTLKTELLPILLIVIMLVGSFYFYSNFPESVPTHWNSAGEMDGWSGKTFGAFFMPLFSFGLYLLFIGLPYLDPKKERYQEFTKVYHIFKALIILFMALIYFATSLVGLGFQFNISALIFVSIGILFIIMGIYMPQIKSNWFIGIRTPWTLSSETVWQKTHEVGGKLFIISGLLFITNIFLPPSWHWVLFGIVVAMLLIGTFGYSLWEYRRTTKTK